MLEKINKNQNEIIIKIQESEFFSQIVLDFNYKRIKQLKNIDESPFSIFKDLKILNLNGTSLQNLNENIFKCLFNLEKLDLSFNKITLLHSNQFSGLKSLKVLNLSFSLIEKIETNHFFELVSCEELYLQTNKLSNKKLRLTSIVCIIA